MYAHWYAILMAGNNGSTRNGCRVVHMYRYTLPCVQSQILCLCYTQAAPVLPRRTVGGPNHTSYICEERETDAKSTLTFLAFYDHVGGVTMPSY